MMPTQASGEDLDALITRTWKTGIITGTGDPDVILLRSCSCRSAHGSGLCPSTWKPRICTAGSDGRDAPEPSLLRRLAS